MSIQCPLSGVKQTSRRKAQRRPKHRLVRLLANRRGLPNSAAPRSGDQFNWLSMGRIQIGASPFLKSLSERAGRDTAIFGDETFQRSERRRVIRRVVIRLASLVSASQFRTKRIRPFHRRKESRFRERKGQC